MSGSAVFAIVVVTLIAGYLLHALLRGEDL